MKKAAVVVAILIALGAASAHAGEGRPSPSKLSKLGLDSLTVVSDQQGAQVRGAGIGIMGGQFFSLAATSLAKAGGGLIVGPATPAVGTFGTIDPATGVNIPFTANYLQGPANFISITASTFGQVQGFAN